uniref:Alternative protein MBTPS1 n=1 Tax=Homo sapiens TaxID=9606 RepID=L8E7W9_HUMAN|nr:alternative protein MBTPS1 [Homo sapiens]
MSCCLCGTWGSAMACMKGSSPWPTMTCIMRQGAASRSFQKMAS